MDNNVLGSTLTGAATGSFIGGVAAGPLASALGGAIGYAASNASHPFIGLNKESASQLKSYINTNLVDPLEKILQDFAAKEDIFESALQGTVKDAALGYVKAVKELLYAYITTYRKFGDDAIKYAQTYEESVNKVSTDVNSTSDEIRQMAAQIRVD